jgi:hypothetical protein
MKKFLLAGAAVLALAGSTAVFAQHRPWMHHHERMNPEDRAAFADARIAAVRAGLKLTPDQEKMWPAVESAVRDMVKLRIDRANARMDARKNADDAKGPDANDNPVTRLQQRADTMATTAAALKKIADAADPLYKTLDDGQKRRLAVLTHMDGRFGGGDGWHHRGRRGGGDGRSGGYERQRFDGPGFDRPGFDDDRGPGRGPDADSDRGRGPGGERL